MFNVFVIFQGLMDKVKDLNVNEEQMMKDIQKGRFTLRYACIVEMIDFGLFFIKKIVS